MRIVYFNAWNLSWWPGTLGPFWLPDLPAYLEKEITSFDIVHLNGYRSLMGLVVARFARKFNIPFVIQPHGSLPVIVNSFMLKRVYDRLFGHWELKGISALLALQESEREQALAHGVPAERIEIIPNGIDPLEKANLPERGSFRRRFGLKAELPLIIFLARINKKKGADMLVEAFSKMEGVEAQLAIIGPDDGQLSEVKSLIKNLNLDGKVVLPGLLCGVDVLAAFQDADLFVLPCRMDTFPVTIMEACLMDTPMVVTDRCEIAHLIQNRVAEVVPFDPNAFAAAMQMLLTNHGLYERYRANCPALISDTFSTQAVVNSLESIYRRSMSEKDGQLQS